MNSGLLYNEGMYRVLVLGLCACGFRHGLVPPVADGSPDDVTVIDHAMPDAGDPSLVAWYKMDALPSNTAPDSSGNGHDGTCTSCPATIAAHIGNGYQFQDQRIDVPATTGLRTMPALTVAFWLRVDADNGSYRCAVQKGYGTGSSNSWQMCVTDASQLYFGSDSGGLGDSLFATNTVPVGQWHHLAITWDGSTKNIWYDAALVASSLGHTVAFDDRPVTLGADIDDPVTGTNVAPFVGVLDDVRIYNRALGSAEIAVLAQ
jgi:hypothetical protein